MENLTASIGAPINTIIHVFIRERIYKNRTTFDTCSVHVTYYRNSSLCKVTTDIMGRKIHIPSASIMYIPTSQIGMIIQSMKDDGWKKIHVTRTCYEGDGFICLSMDDMIGLIRDAEEHINSLLSATNPISPKERVYRYLNDRMSN